MTAADPALLRPLAVPLGCAFAGVLAYVAGISLRAFPKEASLLTPGKAFDIRTVVAFVVLMAAFGLVSDVLASFFGSGGIKAGAVATGLVDVHATAATIGTLVANGKVDLAAGDVALIHVVAAGVSVGGEARLCWNFGRSATTRRV